MDSNKYFSTLFFLAAIHGLSAVKINVHGSVSMGKEVLAFLEHYAIKSQFANSRRSGSAVGPPLGIVAHEKLPPVSKDLVTTLVQSQSFCQDLKYCNENLEKLMGSYIVVLVKSLENILEKLFQLGPKLELESSKEEILENFYERLKIYFTKVENLLKRGKSLIDMSKGNTAYVWVGILKKMNALFQIMTEEFLNAQLNQHRMEIDEINKLLTQKMIIASAAVEEKYLATLCQQHKICAKTFFISDTLYKVIKTLSSLSEEKVGDFMKDFSVALEQSHFYPAMTHPIFATFREVMDTIANPHDVKLKGIFKVLLTTMELRVHHMYQDLSATKTQDIYLFHAILSDMDHFYDKKEIFPFKDFQEDFISFAKFDGHITPKLLKLFKEIEEQLSLEPDELLMKLKNQLKTFLQITLEVDK